ncbi:tetratricopeptide repeat protein [Blastopirellula sp. JC732]|uniref:Tetratricopeptide repeat protein n=1 Tax=Blastopirellula sediminis TaxID=2894196 RepID=A0A9X1MNK8_9BACT|nr:tetratricopeptide repeat protein [Blastopirellula sediminis]MCC9607182.1 tetratricopeptide repeat protein [Blastopirellula sediminis]MCC9629525.1 tetratricopeptide repeat protein [Blastopirellula sediminis]
MAEQEKIESRILELSQAIENDPTNTDTLYELGRALESIGRFEEALSRFESIVLLEPEDHESIHAIGILNLQLGRNSAAILSLRKATELWENQPDYFADLGDALYSSGNVQGAKDAYETAQSLALPNEEICERIRTALMKC